MIVAAGVLDLGKLSGHRTREGPTGAGDTWGRGRGNRDGASAVLASA